MIKNLFTLLLVIAVIATWYFAPQQKPIAQQQDIPTDYFIVQFDRQKMNLQGQLASTFHADRVDHYPDEKKAELVKPRAITYTEGRPPWFIRADHGTQFEENNRIFLTGDVVANQRYPDSKKFTMIESPMLNLFIDQEYLETNQPITFTTESSITRGIGARAWMESGIMHLLKNAAGRYEP